MAESVAPAERFVGRAYELGQIRSMCAAAAEGNGGVAVVSGVPGVGKTRFCTEVANQARLDGHTVVMERCWVGGGAPALWPWQRILRGLCGDDAADLLASDAGLDAVDAERFARFSAVRDRITDVCERAPTCLIIDDIHAADAGTLLLTRFMARAATQIPLTLVVSRTDGDPSDERLEARLLNDLETEATPVVLHQFSESEAVRFLADHGLSDLDPELTQAVLRLTSGNPLFLRRIAALGAPDPDRSFPEHLHVAIDRAMTRLDTELQRILRVSAVLGPTPSVTEVAAAAETDTIVVLQAVDAATAAGLVAPLGSDRFAFTHDLIHAAVERGLTRSEQLDAHARAADAIATSSSAGAATLLARRAHHALAAALRSTADTLLAISACQAAARSMVTGFAYEQADSLLSAAVELHDRAQLGPPPTQLLVEWSQAALLCGRLAEARTRFDRAATVADREAEPHLFAEAALGLGGHWVNQHRTAVERERVLGLQRAARNGLSDVHAALRCRLDARLAAEAAYNGGPVEPMLQELNAARRCGDATALAEALSLGHHALLTPEHTHSCVELADELIQVGSESGQGVLALMGLFWRTVDLFLLGDDRAIRALEDLRQHADALAHQNILYTVGVLDVMLLIRAGRLDEAEARASECYELGNAVGEVDTLAYLGGHTLVIRWIQGRDAELLDMAEGLAMSPTLVENDFAFRATTAALAARAGHRERARTALASLASDGLTALPHSTTWLIGIAIIVEVAATLGDAAIAREAYDLLKPFADRPVMASLAVVCLGSTHRPLGIAATIFQDLDRAIDHLELAIDANRHLANRPLVAISQAELAATLHRRAGAGDRERAIDVLNRAITEADAMHLEERAAAWRTARKALDHLASRTTRREEGHDSSSPIYTSHGVLRREGQGWLVKLDGRGGFVRHRLGITYLAELLKHPGQAIAATTLAGTPITDDHLQQEILDDHARAAYAERVRDLGNEIAEAEAHADIGRAEQLQIELDALVDHLAEATGLHGQSRTFTNAAERARIAVRKAIKRSIDDINAAIPAIGEHLHSTIVTGSTCMYRPDPTTTTTWAVETSPTD